MDRAGRGNIRLGAGCLNACRRWERYLLVHGVHTVFKSAMERTRRRCEQLENKAARRLPAEMALVASLVAWLVEWLVDRLEEDPYSVHRLQLSLKWKWLTLDLHWRAFTLANFRVSERIITVMTRTMEIYGC